LHINEQVEGWFPIGSRLLSHAVLTGTGGHIS